MNGADILDEIVVPRMHANKATTLEIKIPNIIANDYIIETMEPRNVQAVLATKFEDFEIGEKRHRAFRVLLGRSIFTSDGEFWTHSRGLFRPVFSRESINDLEETDKAASILIDLASKDAEPNGWTPKVDLMDHFFRFTLDTSTAFLFGENAGSQLGAAGKLEDGATFDPELTDMFKVAQEWLQWRMVAGSLYWMVTAKKWRDASKRVLEFVDHYVQLALKRKEDEDQGKGSYQGRYNLLSELVTHCHDPLELRDQILGECPWRFSPTSIVMALGYRY
jgi:cytochrome P450